MSDEDIAQLISADCDSSVKKKIIKKTLPSVIIKIVKQADDPLDMIKLVLENMERHEQQETRHIILNYMIDKVIKDVSLENKKVKKYVDIISDEVHILSLLED